MIEISRMEIYVVPHLREKSIPRLPRNERCNFFFLRQYFIYSAAFERHTESFLRKEKKRKEVLPNLQIYN